MLRIRRNVCVLYIVLCHVLCMYWRRGLKYAVSCLAVVAGLLWAVGDSEV